MAAQEEKHRAVIEGVAAARSTARWVQGLVGAGLIAALIGAVALLRGHFIGGIWWMYLVKGGAALGAGIGVKLGARRARRAVRQLPDPVAIELLRPMAGEGDEMSRRVARELMRGLRPEGTEVAAAGSPEGSGSEVVPEPAPGSRPLPE